MSEVILQLNELHPGQVQVMSEAARFNTLCCGRRWGKTTLCEDLLLSPDDDQNGALNGFPVGYFAPTYKNLMEVWRHMVAICYPIIAAKNEQEKRIELLGGGVIDFWSLEEPDTIRGRKYKRAVLDEAAVVSRLKYSWAEVIRPMLTDLRGDAWFLSTPKGKNNYFYDLFKNAEIFADWRSWQMPTVTNPHISADEVDQAKGQLDPLTFAQEYLASFVTENLNAWAYCYDRKKHVGKTQLNRAHEVYLSFDFNRDPICCGVYQLYNNTVFGIELIKLPSSNIYELCDTILSKYNGCMFIVTGDATGKAGNAITRDNLNYYTVIRTKLNLSIGQLRVPTINPPLIENRVLVNSVLHNHNVILDEKLCTGLIFDLEYAAVLPDGSLDKTDRKDPTKQLDALDTFRYLLSTFLRTSLKQ